MPKVNKRRQSAIHYVDPISKQMSLHIEPAINKKIVRNPNFGDEETKCLISLWGNPNIQRTLITSHKKSPIINTLAMLMQQRGFYRSPDEINTRLKNLKCFYNRIKKDLEAGVNNNAKWLHFKAMDAILGKRWNKQDNTRNSYYVKDEHGTPEPEQNNEENLDEMSDIEGTELRPEDLLEVEGPSDNMVIKEELRMDNDHDINYSKPEQKKILPYIPVNSSLSIIPKKNVHESQTKPDSASTSTNRISVVPTNLLLKPKSNNQTYQAQINSETTITGTEPATVNNHSLQNGTLPLQVLLFNGLKQQYALNNNDINKTAPPPKPVDNEMCMLLRQLVEVQNKTLEIEKQKLEVKKQRLEFERAMGTKFIKIIPLLNSIAQNIAKKCSENHRNDSKETE